MERNEFLEMDGLYYESETHEWFNDKTSTSYARKKSISPLGKEEKDRLNVACFVVREKGSGEYSRVIMDIKSNKIIYASNSLEDIAFHIDRLKISKRFK